MFFVSYSNFKLPANPKVTLEHELILILQAQGNFFRAMATTANMRLASMPADSLNFSGKSLFSFSSGSYDSIERLL